MGLSRELVSPALLRAKGWAPCHTHSPQPSRSLRGRIGRCAHAVGRVDIVQDSPWQLCSYGTFHYCPSWLLWGGSASFLRGHQNIGRRAGAVRMFPRSQRHPSSSPAPPEPIRTRRCRCTSSSSSCGTRARGSCRHQTGQTPPHRWRSGYPTPPLCVPPPPLIHLAAILICGLKGLQRHGRGSHSVAREYGTSFVDRTVHTLPKRVTT